MIACAWLIDKGFDVFRKISAKDGVDLVVRIGDKFVGVAVRLTNIDLANPRRPVVLAGNASGKHEVPGLLNLLVSHDGVCAFDRARLQEIYQAAADEAIGDDDIPDVRMRGTKIWPPRGQSYR